MTAQPHALFTTTESGLNRQLPAMRLYEKAKKFGIWNPTHIDLTQDATDWQQLNGREQDILLRLTAMFQAGEEAVTLDLLPLMMVIAQENRIEEEMYLTTFLFEEAKHTDFFSRVLRSAFGVERPLTPYHTPSYHTLFYQTLPHTMQALRQDPSPAAQIRASVTYNMIVEGVLAETGYHGYFTVIQKANILPGVQEGIRLLKQDESRHIAYGIFLISRLLAAQPELWEVVEETMNTLLPHAMEIIGDAFIPYEPDIPFDLDPSIFTDYAISQFQKRLTRLEAARGQSLEELYRLTQTIIDADDA
jgi:ribonucleoside-diphosphate reductase beta chain